MLAIFVCGLYRFVNSSNNSRNRYEIRDISEKNDEEDSDNDDEDEATNDKNKKSNEKSKKPKNE